MIVPFSGSLVINVSGSLVIGEPPAALQPTPLNFSVNNGSWTESPSGTWNLPTASRGRSTQVMVGDGYVQVDRTDAVRQIAISLGSSPTLQDYNLETVWAIIIISDNNYHYGINGGSPGSGSAVTDSGNDIAWRIRREGVSFFLERTENGTDWLLLTEYAITSSDAMYVKIDSLTTGRVISNPIGLGFA